MAEPRVPRLELPSFRRRLRLPSWQRLTRREIRAELDGGQPGSYRCSGTTSRISKKASCGKVAARTPNELSSAWNRVDRDAIRGIPTRIVKRDLQTRKILFHRCRCAPQVLLLPLARFSRIVKVRGHGLVEPAILMLDQDELFDSVLFHEKTQPLPARPGKLRQILKKFQAQRPARNHHQIVILIQIEPTVQKLVETCLKPVIAAVDHQYLGFAALKFRFELKRGHRQDSQNNAALASFVTSMALRTSVPPTLPQRLSVYLSRQIAFRRLLP